MAKFLDIDGLELVWDQIKDKFITKESAQLLVAQTKDSILDGVSSNFDTLKEVAAWINNNDINTSELVEERKSIILPVVNYGFNSNLRINQIINGSSLVDEVLLQTMDNKRQVIIKCGDYYFNVASCLQADTYRGFSVVGINLDPTNENPIPAIEQGAFLYSVATNKTQTFYEKMYTNEDIDEKINNSLTPITSNEIDEICNI